MESEISAILTALPLSLAVLFAFWLYNQDDGEVNVGTWFILAYGDILEFGSYFAMTERWWLNLVPAAFAIGSISTFVFALIKRRFGKIRRLDVFCIVADVAITLLWGYLAATGTTISVPLGPWLRDFDPATISNLAYQGSAVIAFIPMWWSQVEGREIEAPAPWLLWGAAFLGFSILMAYNQNKWEELVYPFLNLFTHFMIGATALTMLYKPSTSAPSVHLGSRGKLNDQR